jgi:hypothetical protein
MVNIPIHESFWQKGGFSGSNIWGAGTKAAPFDHSVRTLFSHVISIYPVTVFYIENSGT